jgi:glycosyltransferase involved in cell wall biosynthesis
VGNGTEHDLHYVFVGSFETPTADRGTGGQAFACATLLASPVSEHIGFALIDSTADSTHGWSILSRLPPAARRLRRFRKEVSADGVDGALLFSSSGFSIIEKGVMAIYAKRRGLRVVLSPRSGLLIDDLARSRAMRGFVRFAFRHCDVVMVQGSFWRDYYVHATSLDASKFVVIPNWIDAGTSRTPEGRRSGAQTTFLYLGRVEAYKGIFDLIDAVDRAREQLSQTRFLVCGRGSAESAARDEVRRRKLDRLIEFRGWVHGGAKEAVFEQADALVLPSRREGLPNSILEAMAASLPVVATRVGGVPEVVEPSGAGFLVDAADPSALAQALVECHSHPAARQEMGRRGQAYVSTHHDISQTWPAVLAVLTGETSTPGLP